MFLQKETYCFMFTQAFKFSNNLTFILLVMCISWSSKKAAIRVHWVDTKSFKNNEVYLNSSKTIFQSVPCWWNVITIYLLKSIMLSEVWSTSSFYTRIMVTMFSLKCSKDDASWQYLAFYNTLQCSSIPLVSCCANHRHLIHFV